VCNPVLWLALARAYLLMPWCVLWPLDRATSAIYTSTVPRRPRCTPSHYVVTVPLIAESMHVVGINPYQPKLSCPLRVWCLKQRNLSYLADYCTIGHCNRGKHAYREHVYLFQGRRSSNRATSLASSLRVHQTHPQTQEKATFVTRTVQTSLNLLLTFFSY
jgi:hypothetical protein